MAAHERDLHRWAPRLNRGLLDRQRQTHVQRLDAVSARLKPAVLRQHARAAERLESLEKLRRSLDPDRPLERGFARVLRADGSIAHTAAALASGEAVKLKFADAERAAIIDGQAGRPVRKDGKSDAGQGDLF